MFDHFENFAMFSFDFMFEKHKKTVLILNTLNNSGGNSSFCCCPPFFGRVQLADSPKNRSTCSNCLSVQRGIGIFELGGGK